MNGSLTVSEWLVVGPPPPVGTVLNTGDLYLNGALITPGSMATCENAGGPSDTWLGQNSTATGEDGTALGFNAQSTTGGTAVGSGSTAGTSGTSLGMGTSSGNSGTAVGVFSSAMGDHSAALGTGATASGTGSVAIGHNASATHNNSTAIGAGAKTTRPNQVVIGTPGTSVTMPGVANGGKFSGRANQSGGVRLLTTDGSGNLGTSFDPNALQNTTNNLEKAVNGLGDAVNSAGAIAAAFSAVPQIPLGELEPVRCGAGVGGYGSQYAVAMGCAARLNGIYPDLAVNAALSLANPVDYVYGTTPSVAGRVGFSVPLFKPKNAAPVVAAVPSPALAQQVETLQRQVQQLQWQLQQQPAPAPAPAPSGQVIRGLW